METAEMALGFDLPVVFVNTVTREIKLIAPGQDFVSVLTTDAHEGENWQPNLRKWVRNLVTGTTAELAEQPAPADPRAAKGPPRGKRLLQEFFSTRRRTTAFRQSRWRTGTHAVAPRAVMVSTRKPLSIGRRRRIEARSAARALRGLACPSDGA